MNFHQKIIYAIYILFCEEMQRKDILLAQHDIHSAHPARLQLGQFGITSIQWLTMAHCEVFRLNLENGV